MLSRPSNIDGGWFAFALYDGGADAARSFVELAATSLATVTTLTLSLTVISLQLASSQYSPRLIEHYLNDWVTRFVYSLFLGTFAFAIATLLNIRLPAGDEEAGSVPSLSIAVLVVLLVMCLGALVFFVHRVTTSMRVEAILERVRDRTFEGIARRADGDDDEEDDLPDVPADARPIRSRRSGHYAAIDWEAVRRFDTEHSHDVWIVVVPGDFVTRGTPVALVDGELDDDLADEVESWLQFDDERWIEREVGYGVRNLADVAVKALSPGVNDPTTAITAIERIGETLAEAGRSHPTRSVTTESGTRVIVAQRTWSDMLNAAVRQIALYGADDVEVVLALTRLLAGLAWAESPYDRRETVGSVGERLRRWVDVDDRDPADEERIEQGFTMLRCSLRHEVVADAPWHL